MLDKDKIVKIIGKIKEDKKFHFDIKHNEDGTLSFHLHMNGIFDFSKDFVNALDNMNTDEDVQRIADDIKRSALLFLGGSIDVMSKNHKICLTEIEEKRNHKG